MKLEEMKSNGHRSNRRVVKLLLLVVFQSVDSQTLRVKNTQL